jgi:hypothetical protein
VIFSDLQSLSFAKRAIGQMFIAQEYRECLYSEMGGKFICVQVIMIAVKKRNLESMRGLEWERNARL